MEFLFWKYNKVRKRPINKEEEMFNKKGFTLVELVMVIVILGILAAVAIPYFYNLSADARDAAEQGVLGGIRAGITTYYANNKTFPATLDAATNAVCSGTNACFNTILAQGGITSSEWAKASATSYVHTGTNTSTYTYTPASGQFVCSTNCP
jgi:prepilin-type N-terminal cleavage/methylation domain-containing protein